MCFFISFIVLHLSYWGASVWHIWSRVGGREMKDRIGGNLSESLTEMLLD